jgi:hypothetical protein
MVAAAHRGRAWSSAGGICGCLRSPCNTFFFFKKFVAAAAAHCQEKQPTVDTHTLETTAGQITRQRVRAPATMVVVTSPVGLFSSTKQLNAMRARGAVTSCTNKHPTHTCRPGWCQSLWDAEAWLGLSRCTCTVQPTHHATMASLVAAAAQRRVCMCARDRDVVSLCTHVL